jgi:cytochrome c-type biogenesis protein
LAFVVAFAAGALSFLSPCVLPLVPGYLSLMSGVGTTQLATQTRTDQRRLLRSTLLFVAGFTVVFVALGATASTIYSVLNAHQRVMNQVGGVVIIVMGLFLAGFVSPRLLQQERRFHVSPSRLGTFAPPVMGMAFALGWTPCIGPALGAVLVLAGAQGTLGRGITMLLAYSLGLGVPFVLAGVAFGRLTTVFAWVRRHFRVINVVSGLVLAAFGLVLLTNNVSWLSGVIGGWLRAIGLDRLTYS